MSTPSSIVASRPFALWPLEVDEDVTVLNLHCLVKRSENRSSCQSSFCRIESARGRPELLIKLGTCQWVGRAAEYNYCNRMERGSVEEERGQRAGGGWWSLR